VVAAMAKASVNVGKLRVLSDKYRPFFEGFAKRERNRSEVSLDSLERSFRDIPRAQIIQFLRELESTGAGRFKVGRGSKHTRFEWAVPMSEVAMAALGQKIKEHAAAAAQPIAPPIIPEAAPAPSPTKTTAAATPINPPTSTPLHVHHLQLHSGKLTEMHVPHNMTRAEAEQIAGYVMSIAL
jgi:hypothetical protein